MKTLILCFLFLSPVYILSQDTLDYEWIMTRPSPLLFGESEGWAIGIDGNDNIYWGVNQDMPGPNILMDATLYKFDSDTNEIWMEQTVNFEERQKSYNLKLTDSLVYVAGRTCATSGVDSCEALFFTNDVTTGNTEQVTIWSQGFGYEELDGIHLEDDGILLTGWTRSDTTAIDLLILKLDYQGNELWRNIWGSEQASRDDHQDGHIVVDDSMIYVSGLYLGAPGTGIQGRSLLAKFDKTNGNFVDSTLYGNVDPWINYENALGMTSDGEFLYCTGFTSTASNNLDLFLAKFDKNLNQIWYTPWGGPGAESARSVHVTSDGTIYVAGITNSYGNGDLDVLLVKFDQAGNPQWYKTWGLPGEDETLDFAVHNNEYYITGRTKSYNQFNFREAFLIKGPLDPLTTSVDEIITISDFNYSIFPNPFDESTTLQFDNPNHEYFQLEITGLDGKVWKRISNINSNELSIEKSNMADGVYFLRLMKQDEVLINEKLIVR